MRLGEASRAPPSGQGLLVHTSPHPVTPRVRALFPDMLGSEEPLNNQESPRNSLSLLYPHTHCPQEE